jgi:RimJ/RimL family protein N-acetyltransferase
MKLPENPVIETKRLLMRDLRQEDLPALHAVNGDAEVVRYTPHQPWKTQADGEAWFLRMRGFRETGAGLQLAIVEKASGTTIGLMLVFNFNEGTGAGEVGYTLATAHWGKGFAKEALGAFIEYCFGPLGLKRLDAQIDPRNVASGKVLERLGFKHEGHQRRNHFAKGEISDTGLYGLLIDDPRPGRPA